MVIGTGPGEGRDGPADWRQGFRDTIEQLPGLRIEAGLRARRRRRRDDGGWRAVHLHLSIGVPDEMLGAVIGG